MALSRSSEESCEGEFPALASTSTPTNKYYY